MRVNHHHHTEALEAGDKKSACNHNKHRETHADLRALYREAVAFVEGDGGIGLLLSKHRSAACPGEAGERNDTPCRQTYLY